MEIDEEKLIDWLEENHVKLMEEYFKLNPQLLDDQLSELEKNPYFLDWVLAKYVEEINK